MNRESWIKKELEVLVLNCLDRHLVSYDHSDGYIRSENGQFHNFSSNNYLNLASHPHIIKTARLYLEKYGAGATASRLVTGTHTSHTELEEKLARTKGYPAAVVFGCGYMTNIGVISVLLNKNDSVFTDRLAHASIIDAIRFSKAKLYRFNHNDTGHLEKLLQNCRETGKKLIITESVFSMDGDVAPLVKIAEFGEKYNAMTMVDEAHSTGVFGAHGNGLVSELKLENSISISMGTFSKAVGSYGGYIACSKELRELVINKSRAFTYTTALPPAVIGSIMGAFEVLESEQDLGTRLIENSEYIRNILKNAGLDTGLSTTQIIPVIIGDSEKTRALSMRLKDKGVLCVAIRPPTVPKGTARLRLSVTLAHSKEVLKKVAQIIIICAQEEGLL